LIQEKIEVNAVNLNGHTPLTLYFVSVKNEKGLSNLSINAKTVNLPIFGESILSMLAKAGADFNHVYNDYKEKSKPLAVKEESKDEIDTDDETQYLSTILLNQIKHSDEFIKRQAADFDMPANNFGLRGMPFGANPVMAPAEVQSDSELMPTLEFLIKNGSTFSVKDSKGRDVMSYAIQNNDLQLVKYLISHSTACKLQINSQDDEGKSAFHYVVNPVGFGSYENAQIFDELKKAGYRTDLKDISDQTPLDYASQQASGVLAAKLRETSGSKRQHVITRRDSSTT